MVFESQAMTTPTRLNVQYYYRPPPQPLDKMALWHRVGRRVAITVAHTDPGFGLGDLFVVVTMHRGGSTGVVTGMCF